AGFLQHRCGRRRLDSHDEVFAVDADAHVPAEEEGDPAEHFFLGDSLAACERVTDARGLGLRIAHACPERHPAEGSKTMTSARSMDRWKTTPAHRIPDADSARISTPSPFCRSYADPRGPRA